jgi:hypothetical protein
MEDPPGYEIEDYTLAELDKIKTENYSIISKENDLDNAKNRLLFDKNFKYIFNF